MAEAFARRALADRGLDVTVSSSGLMPAGHPAPDEVVTTLADRGLDVTGHVSRPFDAEVIASADLLIGMERHHLTEIVAITPEAWTRTFTLPEFVHRVDLLGLEPAERYRLPELLELLAATRSRRDLLRVSVDEEIPDPMGRSHRFFERTADEISQLVDRLVDAIAPAPTDAPVEVI